MGFKKKKTKTEDILLTKASLNIRLATSLGVSTNNKHISKLYKIKKTIWQVFGFVVTLRSIRFMNLS